MKEQGLEEQFAKEMEAGGAGIRKIYRCIFAAYIFTMFLWSIMTDYMQINIVDGFCLGLMAVMSIVLVIQFGMLFSFSYYFRQGHGEAVMEPIECVTEFLPFSKEAYEQYIKKALRPWCRGIFLGTLIIHLIGLHIFTREREFPHFIWEYSLDIRHYLLVLALIIFYSILLSYIPLLCLKQLSRRRLYQGTGRPDKKRKGVKAKKERKHYWWVFVLAFVGFIAAVYILYHMLHIIVWPALILNEKPALVCAPYGELVVMLCVAWGIGIKEGQQHWKKWLLGFLLAIVIVLVADSNGGVFYKDSFVVRHIFKETRYSFDDVGEYELHVEKRLGFHKEVVLSLKMKDGKKVSLNLSRNEMNDIAYEVYKQAGEYELVLDYIRQLRGLGVDGYVRNRKWIEEEIEDMYEGAYGLRVKQCFWQICEWSN